MQMEGSDISARFRQRFSNAPQELAREAPLHSGSVRARGKYLPDGLYCVWLSAVAIASSEAGIHFNLKILRITAQL